MSSEPQQQWPQSFGRGISYLGRSVGSPVVAYQTSRDLAQQRGPSLRVPAGGAADDYPTNGSAGRQPRVDEYVSAVHVISDEKTPLLGAIDESQQPSYVRSASFLQSLFNSCNILLGVGILTFPYAISQSGWCGVIFIVFLAIVTNYTGKAIAYCMEALPNISSYPEIGQAAFGDRGRFVISFVLYTELFCTLSLFFILEGTNLDNLIYPGEQLHSSHPEVTMQHVNMFMAITALVVLPTSWFRDLSVLSYVSVLGLFASLFLLGVVVSDGIVSDLITFEDFRDTDFFKSWANIPLCFGLISFGFAGHAVFPNIYASMKKPQQYNVMLDTTYTFVMLAYGLMAVVGYIQYGDDTEQQVTLNLPDGTIARIATALIVVNPITKFSLTLNPIALGIEELVVIERKYLRVLFRVAVRSFLVGSSLVVAMVVPYFALVVSFIGAFMSMAVSAVFPSMCYMKLFQGRLRWYETVWNIIIIVVGIFCAISGTYVAGKDIFDLIQKRQAMPIST